jgi:MscS family membrane protein
LHLHTKLAGGLPRALRATALICSFLGVCGTTQAADPNPLKPVATGSPRETLQSFLEATDNVYTLFGGILRRYAESDRLYFDAHGRAVMAQVFAAAPRAIATLDVSRISPVLKNSVARERALLLREVLDRIDLPEAKDIPDRAEMTRLGLKKWRLPNTEIDFVLIEEGPRTGEFLVSPETVNRLPEFFARVRHLPIRSDVSRTFLEAIGKLNPVATASVYDAFRSSPLGLSFIVPPRWLLGLPAWAKTPVLGLAPWQWLGLGLGLALGALLILAAYRLTQRLAARNPGGTTLRWHLLPLPLAVIITAGVLLPVVSELFHISGQLRIALAVVETAFKYLAACWLCLVTAILLADWIVSSQHMRSSSLDTQLIRLCARFVGLVGASALLIQGADDLGLPAYSVVAGLGVGGLAIALAARDSVANLLGSVLIMFEKPFRIGHLIRVSGTEGTVEDVGFRSTRIRTLGNSLISIPNNAVVNTTVENLTLRPMRRQQFLVQITYDTPRSKIDALLEGIRKIINEHPFADSTNHYVRFNDFGDSSLNILVVMHLVAATRALELQYREEILLQIMDLVRGMNIEFAFPTRTLHIESSGSGSPVPTT